MRLFFTFRSRTGQGNRQEFQYQLTLPSNALINRPLVGPWDISKSKAKGAVALVVCQKLLAANELDELLLPSNTNRESSPGDRPKKKTRSLSEEVQGATAMNWRIETMVNPKALSLPSDREAGVRQTNGGDSVRRHRAGGFTLHLHVIELDFVSKNDLTTDVVVPECFGMVTCQPLNDLCSFPLFPESMEVRVTPMYSGELAVNPEQLQRLKAFHLSLCEGAYLKGKLLSYMCTYMDNGVRQPSFYNLIPGDRIQYFTLPLDKHHCERHTKNTSWYLIVPLVGGNMGAQPATNGERMQDGCSQGMETSPWDGAAQHHGGGWYSVQDSEESLAKPEAHEEAGKYGPGTCRAPDQAAGSKRVTPSHQQQLTGGRGSQAGSWEEAHYEPGQKPHRDGLQPKDLIDWSFVDITSVKLQDHGMCGIRRDYWKCLKKGDIVMSTYNVGMYQVLGVRQDLNLHSSFPAAPDPHLCDKDPRKVRNRTSNA